MAVKKRVERCEHGRIADSCMCNPEFASAVRALASEVASVNADENTRLYTSPLGAQALRLARELRDARRLGLVNTIRDREAKLLRLVKTEEARRSWIAVAANEEAS